GASPARRAPGGSWIGQRWRQAGVRQRPRARRGRVPSRRAAARERGGEPASGWFLAADNHAKRARLMLVSYRWLRELLPGFAATPADVAVALTGAGLAVDAIRTFGGGARACVVAEVRRVEPHPKRSGLRLVTVDRGGGEQRVVCGAPNVPEPGGLVVLAPLGAELPTFGVLTRRDIGGVTSEGMLCSEAELGLAESSDGLLVLAPGSAAPGTPLSELPAFAEDTIFELDITPNRPDALGHLGVARDLGALLGLPLVPPEGPPVVLERDASSDAWIAVRNDDLERCPHYGAAVVLGVRVGPSPAWLRYRLASLGVRPI